MINIVLVEPDIPQNTGNIARTCAATGSRLHIVQPCGFSLDDRYLKRAGLDYWDKVDLELHRDFDSFMKKYGDRQLFFLSTKADKKYTGVEYPSEVFLLFGKETRGLPEELIFSDLGMAITIPIIKENVRSLNLATSAGIVVYEVIRQGRVLDA